MGLHSNYSDEEIEKIKLDMVTVCRLLNQKNMLAAADGNVSFRISDERIFITPTAINKAFMEPDEIATINIRGDILSGHPSGERLMHIEVFKRCPEARCIVHAHPPTAVAWSLARPHLTELPFEVLPEVILAVGRMPIIPYARPGTVEMGTYLAPVLPKYRVMILSRHGGISWGESISEAYNGMERLEHSAQILKSAVELASMNSISHLPGLPESEIRALQKMREQSSGRTL